MSPASPREVEGKARWPHDIVYGSTSTASTHQVSEEAAPFEHEP